MLLYSRRGYAYYLYSSLVSFQESFQAIFFYLTEFCWPVAFLYTVFIAMLPVAHSFDPDNRYCMRMIRLFTISLFALYYLLILPINIFIFVIIRDSMQSLATEAIESAITRPIDGSSTPTRPGWNSLSPLIPSGFFLSRLFDRFLSDDTRPPFNPLSLRHCLMLPHERDWGFKNKRTRSVVWQHAMQWLPQHTRTARSMLL